MEDRKLILEEMIRVNERLGNLCHHHNGLCDQVGTDVNKLNERISKLAKRQRRDDILTNLGLLGLAFIVFVQSLEIEKLNKEKTDEKE